MLSLSRRSAPFVFILAATLALSLAACEGDAPPTEGEAASELPAAARGAGEAPAATRVVGGESFAGCYAGPEGMGVTLRMNVKGDSLFASAEEEGEEWAVEGGASPMPDSVLAKTANAPDSKVPHVKDAISFKDGEYSFLRFEENMELDGEEFGFMFARLFPLPMKRVDC